MVFDWMITVVSPRCTLLDVVVIVRVTLQELSPKAIPTHVTTAVAIVATILYTCCLLIRLTILLKGISIHSYTLLTNQGLLHFCVLLVPYVAVEGFVLGLLAEGEHVGCVPLWV